ncbi:DUF3180 domain-containing protein [Nocardioides campestrisoli]|uniref:DUF3180 domain-containing protein n=1 Tax=Nocardioides campestrisoli TaxID=2736757 RepID=UPI00163D6E1E|nr:DUF3180 domain-containing protein [Nocardioides campestrisoli]
MTALPPEPPDPGSPRPGEEPPDEPGGPSSLRPLGPGPLTAAVILGLVLGWLWHPVAERLTGTAPVLAWGQALALFFVALILGAVALVTWRAVHVRRERMEARRMVNRLVLARACLLVGALLAGIYTGYLVSWLGSPAELADDRIRHAGAAALGGVTIVVTAKLLERACRVPKGNPHL